jgi:hypothetical protein
LRRLIHKILHHHYDVPAVRLLSLCLILQKRLQDVVSCPDKRELHMHHLVLPQADFQP